MQPFDFSGTLVRVSGYVDSHKKCEWKMKESRLQNLAKFDVSTTIYLDLNGPISVGVSSKTLVGEPHHSP